MTTGEKFVSLSLIFYIMITLYLIDVWQKSESVCNNQIKTVTESMKEPIQLNIHYTYEKPEERK